MGPRYRIKTSETWLIYLLLLLPLFPWLLFTRYFLVISSIHSMPDNHGSTEQIIVRKAEYSGQVKKSYLVHPPIYIDGNLDFFSHVMAENWPGNGTLASPYVIAGLNITGPPDVDLIGIRNTDVLFYINNCRLEGGNGGIELNNVTNAHVLGNIILNNVGPGIRASFGNTNTISGNTIMENDGAGITLRFVENTTISSNFIDNNAGKGINLDFSRFAAISNNILTNNQNEGLRLDISVGGIIIGNTVTHNGNNGIDMHDSSDSTITGNTFNHNGGWGIVIGTSSASTINSNKVINNEVAGVLLWFAENTRISSNTISDNGWRGINSAFSINTTISYNVITRNRNHGIRCDDSARNFISGNNITYNSGYGVYLISTESTVVMGNLFISNNPRGSSQAYDAGMDNSFVYNYWNEWTSSDGNLDGVVDLPYSINGPTHNQDGFPRTSPSPDFAKQVMNHIITVFALLVIILSALGVSLRIQRRA
ncbi:MAG: nitrous oxide reductase family maturation protein NosD [Candidatus Thorarchaeota archaeon]